jgi:hypothetical protein
MERSVQEEAGNGSAKKLAEVTSRGDSQIGKKMMKKAPKSAKRVFGDGIEFRIEKNRTNYSKRCSSSSRQYRRER